MTDRETVRAIGPARGVAEHEAGVAVRHDLRDTPPRELEIDRHRDEAGAHDAVVGAKVLGAIDRQDRDAVAAREAALGQRARHAARHRVERGVGELARGRLAAEIDDRDAVGIEVATNEITEVVEAGHSVQIFAGAVA